jgi:hypothetical protein
MTEYQLLHLRFLRMCADFPELNHRGMEPSPTFENVTTGMLPTDWRLWSRDPEGKQRSLAEREFYRLER